MEHLWAMHPILVLDREFFKGISGNIGLTEDVPTLTYLDVTNFVVKPPSPKALLPNILELTFKLIKFRPTKANYFLNTPYFICNVFNTLSGRKLGKVTHYLEDPNCVDQQFQKLEFVELREFDGTLFELIFLKLILAYSP
ncbi:hypothetical protein H5410_027288 [Solanum commersonii]|uniref:Uncharacterized protein n=1 Tax=Solanum commersonii TaxID=4109 RepID=A0A9J5Z2Z7_SOLCO|nr:hypothetical protein H5410_027288 [Solanum commersonii]